MVDCIAARMRDGWPAFTFECDCGATTEVVIQNDIFYRIEFAYTCNWCMCSHWMTIKRTIEEVHNDYR